MKARFLIPLALFFVLIVIVPMLAVAFLLFRLIDESAQGQAEAAIGQRRQARRNRRDPRGVVVLDLAVKGTDGARADLS